MNIENREVESVPERAKSGAFSRYVSNDIEQHAQNMNGWELCYDQLTPGSFKGELLEYREGGMQLMRDSTNQAMVKRGQAWAGAITFHVPLRLTGQAFCNGHVLNENILFVVRGSNLPDLRTPPCLDVLSVAIEEKLLEQTLEKQGCVMRIADIPKSYSLAGESMKTALLSVFKQMDNSDSLQCSLHDRYAIRKGIQDVVMVQLLDVIVPDDATCLGLTARKRIVDRAREYALSHLDEPLSILELCNNIGASRRKLQYCFQETLGINPLTYLRLLRLNAVRRELCDGVKERRVQEVAARWGFWHLSRFATDYRALFGEKPSQTLYREKL